MTNRDTIYFENVINPFIEYDQYKSKLLIGGNYTIMIKQHYNYFQKLMFKLCFGIKVEDIKK